MHTLKGIPKVSSGSRLLYGLGQEEETDVELEDTAPEESPEEAPEEAPEAAPEESASEEAASEDTSDESSGLSASDVMNVLSAGLTLTSSGIKTAAALGIIKRPVSQAAASAARASPEASAALALQTGQGASRGMSKNLPLMVMGGLIVLALLIRKRK